jgi:ribosomal protein S18 acetylase RimI-like enzyme
MMESAFRLSLAQPDDREKLLELHKAVRYETDVAIVPDYAKENIASGYYEKLWREKFPENNISVLKAETEGQLVGFCSFGAPYFHEYPEDYPDEQLGSYKLGLAELHRLYIGKAFRHQGLGRLLYLKACNRLKDAGYRNMLIVVQEDNKAARQFYEGMGALFTFGMTHEVVRNNRIFHNKVAVYLHHDLKPV